MLLPVLRIHLGTVLFVDFRPISMCAMWMLLVCGGNQSPSVTFVFLCNLMCPTEIGTHLMVLQGQWGSRAVGAKRTSSQGYMEAQDGGFSGSFKRVSVRWLRRIYVGEITLTCVCSPVHCLLGRGGVCQPYCGYLWISSTSGRASGCCT